MGLVAFAPTDNKISSSWRYFSWDRF